MRKFLLLILLLNMFSGQASAEGDILILQSLPIKPYTEALKGFRSVCSFYSRMVISSGFNEEGIAEKLWKYRPQLILAIGEDAFAKVRKIRDVPIVYVMVLNPQLVVRTGNNITGVSMMIAPEMQLNQLRRILPRFRKIGLLFDPAKSGAFVDRARHYALQEGIALLTQEVHSSREAVAADDKLKGKIDALWLIPDTTVVNSETIDLLFLSAIDNRIPLLTFSGKYVEKGALLAIEVDAEEAGRQAGEMANKILSGTNVKDIERQDAHDGIVTVNLAVAKKLDITIDDSLVKRARLIK